MEFISNTIATADPEVLFRTLLQVVLLVSSAFFSGSETALFSLSRMDLQKLRNSRDPQSGRIHELLDEPRRLIISILCGNELVNIASTANMAALMIILVGEEDAGWLNILIMVPLLLLVGEVTPKTFAVTFPIKFSAKLSARLLPKWITFITPLRGAVRFIADRITTLIVGEGVEEENILQTDEFRTLVAEGEETGIIDATERVLIDNMLEASETEIDHIMTPRTRITFLDADNPLTELIAEFKKTQHPRVPIVRGNRDNILGFLHSEDVLRYIRKGEDFTTLHIDDILRPAHFVPPTKKIDEMFEYFRHHNTRAAILLGEYGGVHGMVTMKDVLTFLFGEISGTIRGHELYEEEDDNVYIVPADMRLADFNNLTNFDIEDPMMTTVGGVAFRLFDHLPRVGDTTSDVAGIKFTAMAMDGLRIKTLRVELTSFEREEAEPSSAAHVEVERRNKAREEDSPTDKQPIPVEG
jgi:putative hemolysin